MAILFANNATTILDGNILVGSTTINVVNGALFPSPATGDFFLATMTDGSNHEIVKVTGRTGNAFTVVRAQEGTTAVAWPSGTTISNRITAGTLTQIPPVVIVTGTSQTATAFTHYVLTNVAATTVTLPASPNDGDLVVVTVANSLTSNVIARNGKSIGGIAEDMTIDNQYATVGLRYMDSTRMWRIV